MASHEDKGWIGGGSKEGGHIDFLFFLDVDGGNSINVVGEDDLISYLYGF